MSRLAIRRREHNSVRGTPGFDLLEAAEAAAWAQRIDEAASWCGCKSGAALMLIGMVAWPVKVAITGLPTTPAEIALALATYVVVVIACAVVGKLAGLAVGRFRLELLRRHLRTRLAAVTAHAVV